MRLIDKFVLPGCLLLTQAVFAHGPTPVPGLVDGADPIVANKDMAIALGKALFWDVNAGSDGMACGSCHFHAGADRRVKNQINPGLKSTLPSGQTFETMPSGVSEAFSFLLDAGRAEGLYAKLSIDADLQAAPVPLPAAVWTFLAGLLGILGIKKRKQKTAESV